MTVNVEKSSIQETRVSEHSEDDFITHEDRALLVSLLTEYGDRLLKLCERIDTIKDKYILGVYLAPILGLCLSSIIWFIPFPNLIINKSEISMIILLVFLLSGTLAAIKDRKKLKVLKKEARMIVVRLEKVIRVASPIHENLSPRLLTKLELDLRLADAESALEYYYEIIEKK